MKKKSLILTILILAAGLFLLAGCGLSEILPQGEPYSGEDFLGQIQQAVLAQEEEFTYVCAKDETLESMVEATLDEAYQQYIIGTNVKNFTWTIQTMMDATITLELEYEENFRDDRDKAEEYSPEALGALLQSAVLREEASAELLFRNDGSLNDDLLMEAVNQCVFDSPSALMNYYVSKAQYSIATYADYAAVTVDFTYQEDTVEYDALPIPEDLQSGVALLAEQWDTSDTALLYYPDGAEDPEALCHTLITTATANDADDPYLCRSCEWLVYGESDLLLSVRKIYEYDEAARAAMRQELLAEAQILADNLTAAAPEDNIRELSRLLANRIVYDHELANEVLSDVEQLSDEANIARTAYGALLDGKTVCSGYARAFKLVCDLAGIDCWVVDGKIDGDGHEWNVVFYNGQMAYVDVTFSDTGKTTKFHLFDRELYEKEGYIVDEGFYIPEPAA